MLRIYKQTSTRKQHVCPCKNNLATCPQCHILENKSKRPGNNSQLLKVALMQ